MFAKAGGERQPWRGMALMATWIFLLLALASLLGSVHAWEDGVMNAKVAVVSKPVGLVGTSYDRAASIWYQFKGSNGEWYTYSGSRFVATKIKETCALIGGVPVALKSNSAHYFPCKDRLYLKKLAQKHRAYELKQGVWIGKWPITTDRGIFPIVYKPLTNTTASIQYTTGTRASSHVVLCHLPAGPRPSSLDYLILNKTALHETTTEVFDYAEPTLFNITFDKSTYIFGSKPIRADEHFDECVKLSAERMHVPRNVTHFLALQDRMQQADFNQPFWTMFSGHSGERSDAFYFAEGIRYNSTSLPATFKARAFCLYNKLYPIKEEYEKELAELEEERAAAAAANGVREEPHKVIKVPEEAGRARVAEVLPQGRRNDSLVKERASDHSTRDEEKKKKRGSSSSSSSSESEKKKKKSSSSSSKGGKKKHSKKKKKERHHKKAMTVV